MTEGRPYRFLLLSVKAAAAATALWMSGGAVAQVWTFEQLAKRAAETHPAILSKLSSETSARADLEGANWQRFPAPTVEAGNDTRNTRTALLRLQQPLWAGGRIDGAIDAAQARFDASHSAVTETAREVVLKVIAAFVEAWRQQERVDALSRAVQQHERLLGLISRRVEHEASPRVDQELAQSRLLQANNDLSGVSQALANALTQLSQLTGNRVARVGPPDTANLNVPESMEVVLDEAVKISPTLRRLEFEEEAAQADVAVKKASMFPQLALRVEHGYASAPLSGIPAYTTNRVMIVLEAQPGAGLSALAGVDAAVGRREAARQQRETAMRDIQERTALDWDELSASRTRLRNSSLASRSSQEVYQSYERQYTAGRKTWLDLLNTVRESTQAEAAVVDANAQVAGASLRLNLATGKLIGLLK